MASFGLPGINLLPRSERMTGYSEVGSLFVR
jgi:hypothetical protein